MDLYNWFWSDSFWLPAGHKWTDLKNAPGDNIYRAQAKDINWAILLGVFLLLVRYIFEVHIMAPFAVWLGVKDKKKSQTKPNPVLEKLYNKNGFVNNNDNIQSIAKQTDMTVREVEVWLRDRHKECVPSKAKKFAECSWHFTFYLTAFIYGIIVLWDKDWFWDTKQCWLDWPHQHVPNDVYWYYMIELSFYWCLVFSVLTDHRRKDFTEMMIHHVVTIILLYFSWVTNFPRLGCVIILIHDVADSPMADFKEMMIHHMATISLLYFSWAVNFVRIGTLVLVVHDIADIPLSLGKMTKYLGKRKLTEGIFVVFILFWVISRLIVYPFRVILCILPQHSFDISFGILGSLTAWVQVFLVLRSSIGELYMLLPPFNAFYLFNGLLLLLQILHLIWSYMIAKIAYNNIFYNKVEDIRSDTESEEEEE